MTREEAWRKAKGYLYDVLTGNEADEIIKALEQDEDCVSRKKESPKSKIKALPPVTPQQEYGDIVKAFQFGLAFGFAKKYDEMDEVMKEVKKAATPKPKIGHWIELDEKSAVCSCCYKNNTLYGDFCKWCGAKMEVKNNE